MSPKLIIGPTFLSIRISIAPFYILMHYTSLRRLCTSLRKQCTRHCEEFRVARYEAIPEILWQSTPTVKVVHHKYRHCEEFGVARYEAIPQILWQSTTNSEKGSLTSTPSLRRIPGCEVRSNLRNSVAIYYSR